MRIKDFVRRSLFENYSIQIEGQDKAKLVCKDYALKTFGWMHITDIDYTIIFVNKGGDYGENSSHESQVIPRLLVKSCRPKEHKVCEYDYEGGNETIFHIKCPKCSSKLTRKKEGWNEYPYCHDCNSNYDVFVNGDEMKITITEVNK